TGKRRSRNQNQATTLFSGTLFCEYCNAELGLYRSAGRYKQMGCPSGCKGLHGCKLTTSKSTKIIERCILSYIRESLFTAETIGRLVPLANAFLEEESRHPRRDLAPLHRTRRDLERKIQKLVKQVEDEENESLCKGYHRRIKELQRELNTTLASI